jgi:hypothetical protein
VQPARERLGHRIIEKSSRWQVQDFGRSIGFAYQKQELCPHAAAPATEAAAPEATEASTAASRRIAGTSSHGYEPTREEAMAAFAKSWRRE